MRSEDNPELVIVGTGGLAREVAFLCAALNKQKRRWLEITFCAEKKEFSGQKFRERGVVYADSDLERKDIRTEVVIAIGEPQARHRVFESLSKNPNLSFPNVFHRSVDISIPATHIGIGNIFTSGVVLSCDTYIGNFNVFNWYVTVGHDCKVGSFNTLNPHAAISGSVSVGDRCLIGAGSVLLERIEVADATVIGAGAVLTRSVKESSGVYVGVPARRLAIDKHQGF